MIKTKEIEKIKFLFNLNGYAVVKKSIPKKLINEIQKEVHQLIEQKFYSIKLESLLHTQ